MAADMQLYNEVLLYYVASIIIIYRHNNNYIKASTEAACSICMHSPQVLSGRDLLYKNEPAMLYATYTCMYNYIDKGYTHAPRHQHCMRLAYISYV